MYKLSVSVMYPCVYTYTDTDAYICLYNVYIGFRYKILQYNLYSRIVQFYNTLSVY